MKGFILIAISSIITLSTKAQHVFYAYENGVATPDTLNSRWYYYNVKPTTIFTIIIQNKIAKMKDV
ncbi:MAG TPA: hypothetical protein VK772_02230, partial [Puia sp.]|nr:hypothetical protein [Puia sp.]